MTACEHRNRGEGRRAKARRWPTFDGARALGRAPRKGPASFRIRKFFPAVNTRRPRQKNFEKKLVHPSLFPYLCLAQFRTCLWSCVGWRGSDKRPINRQFQPAAGGEPANPAKRGTRLEATTDRAFSSLSALQRLATEEACLSCRACGGENSFPIDGVSRIGVLPSRDLPTAQHMIGTSPLRLCECR